jgi:ribosome maturation factor RimP
LKTKPIEEIESALAPIASELNVEIVEVEFKQGREPALTVYIDT